MKNIPALISKFSLKAEGGTNSVNRKCNPLRRSCVSSARNAGESAICPARATLCGDRARRGREMQARVRFVRCAQPSAEIVRSRARNAGESATCPVPAQPCRDCACRVRKMQARVRFVPCARPLRTSCASRARNAGESALCQSAICPVRARIARVERAKRVSSARNAKARVPCVEGAKCRRACDLSHARALCGDRACRVREMQARARFVPCARNPLRSSCVSRARNAGESAICPVRAQPLLGDRPC